MPFYKSITEILSQKIIGLKEMQKKERVENIFRILQDTITRPESELMFQNEFQLLIAVILSAQATDISVNKVTPALFKVAPTPEKMVELGEEGLKFYIKTIGLYNSKAKNIIKCCEKLIESFNSQVPEDRAKLESLGGVGKKTAGVVLNVAFHHPTIPVDTHVYRVSNRMGVVKTKTPDETEKKLLKVVPNWAKQDAHHLLILHGRYTCKARKPLCGICAVSSFCTYKEKTE